MRYIQAIGFRAFILSALFIVSHARAQSDYAVVERGADYKVLQKTTVENGTNHVHRYTELATGMNYLTNGQWSGAQEKIEAFSGGAIARHGQYQVIFANNLNSYGAVDVQTPDKKRLRSNVLGLGYYDRASGKSALIGRIQDSQGQLISANQVLYPDAFQGVKADVRYTYNRGSFEQDVILREQPPLPEAFGLASATTELEVMTEFLNPPTATVQPCQTQKNVPLDENISWGAMRLGQGKAFDLGQPQSSIQPVQREYENVSGRHILLEIVPFKPVQASLKSLPLQSSIKSNRPMLAVKMRELPATPPASVNARPIKLASRAPNKKGYVLDYLELNSDQGDFTFQSDTTYYISGPVNFSGAVTLEGGTVIKCGAGSTINVLGTINCQTAAYRPAVFTSPGDFSVGDVVYLPPCTSSLNVSIFNDYTQDLVSDVVTTGGDVYDGTISSGNADNFTCDVSAGQGFAFEAYDAADDMWLGGSFQAMLSDGYIWVNTDGITSYSESGDNLCNFNPAVALSLANGGNIHDVRISNVDVGIASAANYSVANAQFFNCGTALQTQNATNYTGNVLMGNVGTGFSGENYHATAENVTIDQATQLTENWYGSSALTLVNSLLTAVTDYGMVTVTTNSVVNLASNTGIYQTVKAGSYYLATNSPYRDCGTTNVDPELLANLQERTTYPPKLLFDTSPFGTLVPAMTVATNFYPCAQRDTNAPDLGYHYDPLDYAFGGCTIRSNVTFAAGTAVGWYANDSILITNQSTVSFLGTASSPCYWVRLNAVQENDNYSYFNTYDGQVGIDSSVTSPSAAATVNAQFLKTSSVGGLGRYFSSASYLTVRAQNCEFYNAGVGGHLNLTNCLFDRSPVNGTCNTNFSMVVQNCTLRGASFNLPALITNQKPTLITNTVFDATGISMGSSNTNYARCDYNAFLAGANRLTVHGAHDVIVSNSFNWQSSWLGDFYLPSGSPLIDAGSAAADRIGLYQFTTQTSQAKEADSLVDIGYHYVAADANGKPVSTLTHGVPDYVADANGNGLPDAWEWYWFGNYTHTGGELDANGDTLLSDYQNGFDPDVIQFALDTTNDYVSYTNVSVQLSVTAGVPVYYAVLVNDTNHADANWQPYAGTNLAVNLGTTDGVYEVEVGLKGIATNAMQAWEDYSFTLDRVAPKVSVTSPVIASGAATTVIKPYLQLQGFANEQLSSLSYDISNAVGLTTNQDAFVTDQYFDTNKFDFTTNWFQAYDVPLVTNGNSITLRVTDRAGNTTTTNFNVTLDYSTATNPVIKLTWPTNGMQICGNSFTLRGWVDDETASVAATITDTNGDINTVIGSVERSGVLWVENLPLNEGTNIVTLWVTNAAGLPSTTNLMVIKNDMVLTVNNIIGNLWQPRVTVVGSISEPDYSVCVNGIQGTNNRDGTWRADNVPVSASGVASFDVSASSSSGDPDFSTNIIKDAEIVLVQYNEKKIERATSDWLDYTLTRTKSYQANYQTNNSGQWFGQDYFGTMKDDEVSWLDDPEIVWNYHWSSTNAGAYYEHVTLGDGTEYDYTNGDSQATAVPDVDLYEFGSEGGLVPGQLISHYFANNVHHAYVTYGMAMDLRVTARTRLKLFTGGKAGINHQNLFRLQCSATEYGEPWPGAPVYFSPFFAPWVNVAEASVDPSRLRALGKKVGGDGYLWVVLPDNASPDLNLRIPSAKHYNAGATQTKIIPHAMLAVDMNRDGGIDFATNGPDATSQANPYCFWLNNNHDGTNYIWNDWLTWLPVQVDLGGSSDIGRTTINCKRDLEDYTRLGIKIDDVGQRALTNGFLKIKLEATGLQIRIFPAADNDGVDYLKNASIAQKQLSSPYNTALGAAGTYEFDKTFWTNYPNAYLLFDGVSDGNGNLKLTIWKDGKQVGESPPVYLKLKDVKDMYDTWKLSDSASNIAGGSSVYNSSSSETSQYILFVHGWNISDDDKLHFANTAYKRLWWQGYAGHFGAFFWPTLTGPTTFNRSERIAWNSAAALANTLTSLDSQYGSANIYLFAHSMGNVVAGEALKKLNGTGNGVNAYVACQAAVPSHAYNSDTDVWTNAPSRRDDYIHYPTSNDPCYFYDVSSAASRANFFNANDWALHRWIDKQRGKPNSGYSWDGTNYWRGSTLLLHTNDTYEIFAICVQSPCYCLGATDIGNVFPGVDLQGQGVWGGSSADVYRHQFSDHPWHSGEFEFSTIEQWGWWKKMMNTFGLPTSP